MYDRMNRLIAALTIGLHERDEPVRLGLLASMAGESMFLLGPPGVGKSLIARRLQMVFADARSFSYLMGRFSTPDEVFGPLSVKRLKQDDRYERVTTDYLPNADVVFLDEIWKASAPIRNALLTALNERLYRNGSQELSLPLKVFIGASNELPENDDTAAAFWDRFLIRLVLGPINDAAAFRAMLDDTDDVYADVVPAEDKISTKEYEEFQKELTSVAIPETVSLLLVDIRNRLREAGDGSSDEATAGEPAAGEPGRYVSDRRWKKIVHLLRASARLHGRDAVEPLDCAIVRHCVWDDEDGRDLADRVVMEALTDSAANPETLARVTSGLSHLDEAILSGSVEEVEEESTQPVVYREEYYRLLGSADPAGARAAPAINGGNEQESIQVLIWRGDVNELASSESGLSQADIFRYDTNDQLVGSEEVTLRQVAPWVVEMNGTEWEIETEARVATTTRSRDLATEERGALLSRAEELVSDIRTAAADLLAERDAIDDHAKAHLFVTRRYATAVTAALESAAEQLVGVRIAAEELVSQLQEQ